MFSTPTKFNNPIYLRSQWTKKFKIQYEHITKTHRSETLKFIKSNPDTSISDSIRSQKSSSNHTTILNNNRKPIRFERENKREHQRRNRNQSKSKRCLITTRANRHNLRLRRREKTLSRASPSQNYSSTALSLYLSRFLSLLAAYFCEVLVITNKKKPYFIISQLKGNNIIEQYYGRVS